MPYRSGRACPVCGHPIEPYRTRSYGYEKCTRCLGLWMPMPVLMAMCAEILPGATLSFEPFGGGTPRGCPDCHLEMERAELFRIPIDVCRARSHGIWLDKGELAAVLERVADDDPPPPEPPSSFTSLLEDFFSSRR